MKRSTYLTFEAKIYAKKVVYLQWVARAIKNEGCADCENVCGRGTHEYYIRIMGLYTMSHSENH